MSEIGSAFVSILPSASGFNKKLDSEITPGINSSGKKSGLSFGKLFAIGAGLGLGAKAFSFLGDSLGEAKESQKVSALVANAIKATGGAANVTAGQVDALSSALSAKTGIDDEAIATGASLILTFKNVANQGSGLNAVFDRATAAAVDLSAAGFGSIDGASKQLGKALNDPVKGLSALSRSGVTFTEGQQKQIKAMVENGNLLGAQKRLLKEVEGQVGGAGAATATAGEKAAVAFGNLKEQVGTALLPTVEKLSKTFTSSVVPAISGFITGMQTGAGAGGMFAGAVGTIGSTLLSVGGFLNQHRTIVATLVAGYAAFKVAQLGQAAASAISLLALKAQTVGTIQHTIVSIAAGAASKVFAAGQFLLNAALTANPIGLVIVGLVALGAGLVIAYKKSDTFRAIVNKAFSSIRSVVSSVVGFLGQYVPQVFSVIATAVKIYVGVYKAVITTAFNVVKAVIVTALGIVKANINTAGKVIAGAVKFVDTLRNGVKEGMGKVADFFRELPGKIKGFLTDLPGEMFAIGGRIIQGMVNGLTAVGHKVTDYVSALINKIPKKIRQLMGIASPSKVTFGLGKFIGLGLADGIESMGKRVADAAGKAADKARDALTSKLKGFKDDFKSLSESVSGAFTGNLFEATTAGDFITNLTGVKGNLIALKGAFKTLLGYGVSPGFLSQLFASGNGALAIDLANGGKAQAVEAASLFQGVTSLSTQLGNKVATKDVGPNIDRVRDEIRELRKDLKENAREFGREINGAAGSGMRRGKRGVVRV